MKELPFTIRLVSPAFVSSAPSSRPKQIHYLEKRDHEWLDRSVEVDYYPVDPLGVRIPSLRGVLEFWYRSLLGNLPSDQVFSHQATVFGSTSTGQGLRLRVAKEPQFKPGELRFTGDIQPFLYLGYGPLQFLKQRGEKNKEISVATTYNKTACRDAILVDPDAPVPEFHYIARGTEEGLRELKRSLILLHLFGGVGARSRRGWGSVEVVAPFIPQPPTDVNQLAAWFTAILSDAMLASHAPLSKSRPRFSAFSAKSQIRLTPPVEGGWREVLHAFYRRFQEVRLWNVPPSNRHSIPQKDHSMEKVDGDRSKLRLPLSGVPKRVAYGMPYSPQSRRSGWGISYVKGSAEVDGPAEEQTRRASPLFLKVLRLADGKHVGVILFLEAQFFGDGTNDIGARVGKNPKPGVKPFPGYAAVEEYLKEPTWKAVSLPADQEEVNP